MSSLSYKKAGVDIKKQDVFVKEIRKMVSLKEGNLSKFIAFGDVVDFSKVKNRSDYLVFSCDGVGTKVQLAQKFNRHWVIGVDCVAMNVNDIICRGAVPLYFSDYIACHKIDLPVLKEIIRGIVKGCKEAGCRLIGGETAQMPSLYKEGEYDLAGFCIGVVSKKNLILSENIKEGDLVLGLSSNGLHSNGFSLVRKVFNSEELKKHRNVLLKPTRIYSKIILSLIDSINKQVCVQKVIKGMAHITGGAFINKAPKILPQGLSFLFYKESWSVPSIFKIIQEKGNISTREMYTTFNMGIGFIIVIEPSFKEKIISFLKRRKIDVFCIGEVVKGNKVIIR